MNEADNYLHPEDVTEKFLIPTATLATWRHRGLGPPYLKAGRRVLYLESAVRAWLDSNTADLIKR